MILQKMKQSAEDYLGQKVEKAVITVPAISTTRNARPPRMQARLPAWKSCASLTSRRGALAYGLDKKKDETIAVFDFGAELLTYLSRSRRRCRGS